MRKITFLLIICIFLGGCVTLSRSYKLGREAAVSKDWDEAVRHYERAVVEDPKNSVYRIALFRAKISASNFHVFNARSFANQGKKEEALKEYEKALAYEPSNRMILEEMKQILGEPVKKEKPKEVKISPPIQLKLKEEKIHLKFPREASLRSIFQALGKHAQVNILFDEQFKDIPFSIDLEHMMFEQALESLCLATKNFYRIIDERTIIVVPDQPIKRAQYDLQAIRTFYLSNVNAQDIQVALAQMLRTQFKAPSIIIDKNLNSVTVRDVPEVIELAEKIIRLWDKPKGEVIIDLEIMEVSRMKLQQLGMSLDKYMVGFSYGGETEEETGWINLKGIDFTKAENFQVVLPSTFLQFLESDVDTKIISQPRLRGIEGEKIEYMVGDEIPIPRTTFTPIAAGGIAQQPVTSFEYKSVGIDVKITPRIHFEKEITLELEIKIKSLGGTGYADLPIISTREVKNIIRLKDGETNLLAGLLKDEERRALKGIAGLKNIPVLGSLFSNTDKTIQQTDVILTITPYIIRTIPVSKEDATPLWVGVGESSVSKREDRPMPRMEFRELELERARARRETSAEREVRRKNQIYFNTASLQVPQNREFRIPVNIRSEDEVSNMSFSIDFNPKVLELKEVVIGNFIRQLGKTPPFLENIDNSSGRCTIGFSSEEIGKGAKGTGTVVTLVFKSLEKGESRLIVTGISANSPTGQSLSFESQETLIIVQ